jgi:hypothetical protein
VTVNADGLVLTTCELDTHADTCCFGKHSYLLSQDLNNVAEVSPFLSNLGTLKRVPVATVAVAYDCPRTYQTYILIFHQSLYIEQMDVNLLCPNQLREAGVIVNDIPLRHLPQDKRDSQSHSILTKELHIPLTLRGKSISYFTV